MYRYTERYPQVYREVCPGVVQRNIYRCTAGYVHCTGVPRVLCMCTEG